MLLARLLATILYAILIALKCNAAFAGERDASKTFQVCQDVESSIPDSAQNSFSPFPQQLLSHLKAPRNVSIQWLESLNATVTEVKAPKHGKVSVLDASSFHYTYTPEPGYVGKDQAVFIVQTRKQKIEVIINFLVLEVVWEEISQCRHEKFSELSPKR